MNTSGAHISPYCGSWFPADANELRRLLDRQRSDSIERTGPWLAGNAAGFVAPHAGLAYSGTVAAAVYRHVAARPTARVVLLGFSHRGGARGLLLPAVSTFETPLGNLPVDRLAVESLAAHPPFRVVEESAVCDHSLEMQLPLLKLYAPDARLVPLYVNDPSEQERHAAADLLRTLLGNDTVFIASSDLTHFGREFGCQPFPVDEHTRERLEDLDNEVIDAAGSVDSQLFLAGLRESGSNTCGFGPIALLLETLEGGGAECFQRKLDYQTSGELSGDFRLSVGYGALGYFPPTSFEAGAHAQRLLLDSAHGAIRAWQTSGRRIVLPARGEDAILAARLGAFVSVYVDGALRGCVGALGGCEPLATLIPELALSAALDDRRFDRLSTAESNVRVEISILSPLKRVSGKSGFIVDRHGALLEAGSRQGLLLPQVATERGWGATEFFAALALKAGLTERAYDDPATKLSVFCAQHF